MATLHVRNVPDHLYERLRRLAREEHRSLSAEVIGLLEDAVAVGSRRRQMHEALETLHAIAQRNGPVPEGTAADLIREVRDES